VNFATCLAISCQQNNSIATGTPAICHYQQMSRKISLSYQQKLHSKIKKQTHTHCATPISKSTKIHILCLQSLFT